MTVQELKTTLLGKEYPENIKISPDQIVLNPQLFLKTQFLECDRWTREIEKCPAYIRLIKFHEAIIQQ